MVETKAGLLTKAANLLTGVITTLQSESMAKQKVANLANSGVINYADQANLVQMFSGHTAGEVELASQLLASTKQASAGWGKAASDTEGYGNSEAGAVDPSKNRFADSDAVIMGYAQF